MDNEDLLRQLHKQYQDTRDEYVREINKSETEAVKQLIFVATIFFTASLFVLQNDGSARPLDQIYKVLLVISWVGFSISMGLGISIFLRDRSYFDTWATAAEKIVLAVSQRVVDTPKKVYDLAEIEYKRLPEYTPEIYLRLQILFLAIGVICLLIVGANSIF